MRKLVKYLVGIALLLIVSVSGAYAVPYQVNINGYDGYRTGSGGEFSVTPLTGPVAPILDRYSEFAKKDGAFETFCLEYGERIDLGPNVSYYYQISDRAKDGGLDPAVGGDPISMGTAWLYSQFAAGALDGYNYTVGVGRAASAGLLQNAIWMLEDELLEGQTGYDISNIFIQKVITSPLFGGTLAGAKDNNNGLYRVGVLNLYKDAALTQLAQDQLIMVPEPGTLILLGFGLIGVVGMRRKFKK